MDVQNWFQIKNDITRRRFLELHLDALNALPVDQLAFYLNDLIETSARRIQAVWRGYRTRKLFSEQRRQLAKEKAAVTIQRQVRHWLHNKAEKREYLEKKPDVIVSRINEDRLQELQKEADRWQENHEIKFPGMKQLANTHCEVQKKLANFYWQVSETEICQQRMEARCAQLEAISLLMKELPPLSQSKDVDLNWYHCHSLPLATSARVAHKQHLKSLNAPWWYKLKGE